MIGFKSLAFVIFSIAAATATPISLEAGLQLAPRFSAEHALALKAFSNSEKRYPGGPQRMRHSKRNTKSISVVTSLLGSLDSNLQPLLDSLNNTVAQVLAGNLNGAIKAIETDLEDVLKLLDGIIGNLLNVGKGPQPSAGPGPAPPPPDCLTTKQLTSIITKVINELQPILRQIEGIPALKDALGSILVNVDSALTQVVLTLNKVVAEVLDLVCTILKDVEGLLTNLGLGAVTKILQGILPL